MDRASKTVPATHRSGALNWLGGLGRGLVDLCFPRFCQLCRSRDCPDDAPYVCRACVDRVVRIRPPCCGRCGMPFGGAAGEIPSCWQCGDFDWAFQRAESAVRLRGTARDILHRFKYRRQVYWRGLLAGWLEEAAGRLPVADLIVPVPLFPRREREREYNQSALLAEDLSRRTGVPLQKRALVRTRDTATQTSLDRSERLLNQSGAYRPGRAPVAGQIVLLVDDVFTTGATTHECAKTLVQAGAKKVLVLTVARG